MNQNKRYAFCIGFDDTLDDCHTKLITDASVSTKDQPNHTFAV